MINGHYFLNASSGFTCKDCGLIVTNPLNTSTIAQCAFSNYDMGVLVEPQAKEDLKCECGASKVGSNIHSPWCNLHEDRD